ncbi:hypothetical protein EDD16DRAFT_1707392 [Pisolithus croceorrhizus]|nr:hypothetical protein EV401DRAFT_2073664 [Pisolithus croceorrhizus]KAI6117814.1 hypothetical protein EDD16DRAFT_1707392 [Pisolithus croceorrhizus]
MSLPQAVSQLLGVESLRAENVLSPKMTLVIALSRVVCDAGSDNTQQRIVCGALEQLSEQPPESFEEPLHSLVIVGKRLHHLEVVYAEEYAVFMYRPKLLIASAEGIRKSRLVLSPSREEILGFLPKLDC